METIYLKGKLKWVQTQVPDKYGKWKCVIYPDAESEKIVWDLQKKGVKNLIKKDDDGTYVTYSRPTEIQLRSGKKQALTPPELLGPDNQPLKGVLVGNGSDGIIKLEVYKHGTAAGPNTGTAARLSAIRVDNLVPYELKRDFTPEQQNMVKGLTEQPKMLF